MTDSGSLRVHTSIIPPHDHTSVRRDPVALHQGDGHTRTGFAVVTNLGRATCAPTSPDRGGPTTPGGTRHIPLPPSQPPQTRSTLQRERWSANICSPGIGPSRRGERRWTLHLRHMTANGSSTPAPHASDSLRNPAGSGEGGGGVPWPPHDNISRRGALQNPRQATAPRLGA